VVKVTINRMAQERLERVRLWHRKDDRVGGFSGGMRRRLSMLLSTIGDPKLLILDEVISRYVKS
jgi:ABC-type multidrug transport system ATPase subunit